MPTVIAYDEAKVNQVIRTRVDGSRNVTTPFLGKRGNPDLPQERGVSLVRLLLEKNLRAPFTGREKLHGDCFRETAQRVDGTFGRLRHPTA
jgi:hypothetical protein